VSFNRPSAEFDNTKHLALKNRIDSFDFECLKFKLVTQKGWGLEKADQIEKLYKGFLLLSALFPERSIVPTKDIDEMWHMHILDTIKYHEECQALFGRYLHHFPYFGIRSEEDAIDHQAGFNETQSIFRQIVGTDMFGN
jgi:hypothetical protein